MENEGGLIVQPFYLACDESSYMSDDGIVIADTITWVSALNRRILREIIKLTVHP